MTAEAQQSDQTWADRHWCSSDGLRLYARDYGNDREDALPVLCLCGLTRTSREFHVLAEHLSKSRRVICPDYRGRGRSQQSPNWATYLPVNETADVIGLLDYLGIRKAFVIGTSRGGLNAMMMATMHRHRLAGVVFNDIGPVIDKEGLLRILQYVGKTAHFTSWDQAVDAVKRTNVGFDTLSEEEWEYFARFSFADEDGRPVIDCDPQLARTMPSEEQIINGPAPDLWPAFEALEGLPVAVIRGEHSDFLSEATISEMERRVSGTRTITIPNRGHTPFLTEPEAIEIIEQTLLRADRQATA